MLAERQRAARLAVAEPIQTTESPCALECAPEPQAQEATQDPVCAHECAQADIAEPAPEPIIACHPLSLASPEPTPKRKRTPKVKTPAPTSLLEDAMINAIKSNFGAEVVTKKWAAKERTLAKKLIDTYGLEMSINVITGFVGQWGLMARQSRGRLYGLPTINFLWGAQDRFFGAAQLNQTVTQPGRADEYQQMNETDDDW